MINDDTLKLLNEISSGVKMGMRSIDDIITHVKSQKLKAQIDKTLNEHKKIEAEVQNQLDKFSEDGKKPNPVAAIMAETKSGIKLSISDNDATIADLLFSGCAMGIKSLNKYINKYKAADSESMALARHLSESEEQLLVNLKPYL